MDGIIAHSLLLVILILVQDTRVILGRSTTLGEDVGGDAEIAAAEEVRNIDFKVHILTKREADEPGVAWPPSGRTFPASDPLDPNGPLASTRQDFFKDFETVNEIFQPNVQGESEQLGDAFDETDTPETNPDTPPDDSITKSDDTKTPDADAEAHPQDDGYGAQYPYPETTRTSGYHQGSGQVGNPSPYDQSYESRRTVLTGRSGEPTTHTEYVSRVQTNRNLESQTHSGSQYPTSGSSNTYNRQYQSGTQYPTGGTGTQYSGYQTSGSSTRGAYYDGPRYIDNNGHYIDANGRHLDSTGRYYDTSGRYQDATVTRTVTYRGGPTTAQRYTDSSGQSFSYLDSAGSTGRQYGGSLPTGSTGRQYGGSLPTGSTGTQYSGSLPTGSTGRQYGESLPTGTSSSNYGSGAYTDQYGTTEIGGTPINSVGTQFYSGGQGYPATYDPVVSQISNDPNCPSDNLRVTINGLPCANAVSQLGPYVCYNYERVSTECCERCLQVKRAEHQGCEYGDRSQQCTDIQPLDCYNERNSQVCCQRCQAFRLQRPSAEHTCRYGDWTPRCQELIQRSHLCYLPDNQRMCCDTCPRMANQAEPDCKWGNQNPELCSKPFDAGRRLRLNCYLAAVQEICCSTCKSLRDRIRETIPGCEFGDHPVQISTARGVLDCGEYIRFYGVENCDGGEIAQKCCHTCYRYRARQTAPLG